MNIIAKSDLQMLMESSRGPCASLFLPTHRLGAETRQNPLRLKKALREIENRLPVYGLRSNEMQLSLDPLQDMVKDELFWQYQEAGLALFRSLDVFSYHCLPFRVQQEVIVSRRFHFKPLLSLLSDVERFYILALSQYGIRLFQATPYSTSEAALPDAVPRNLLEIARSDGSEKYLQFHTNAPVGRGSRRRTLFHGHGGGC
jgi:Bacterial archaeo-eukaryotic release factor family 7